MANKINDIVLIICPEYDTQTNSYYNKLYYIKGASGLNHTKTARLTQYPTVSGKSISDNSYVEPISLSMNIICSRITGNQSYYINEKTNIKK